MSVPKRWNINTVLISLVGVLLAFGIKKLDDNNTSLIELGVTTRHLSAQVADIRGQVQQMVPKSDFDQEVSRINREIDALRKFRPTSRP